MKQLIAEFKAFILKGNVISLAVAFVIGAAFTELVKSATAYLISPLLGMLLAGKGMGILDFKYCQLGSFLMAVLNFLITGAVVFFIFVKPLTKLGIMPGEKADDKPPGPPPATLDDVVAALKELKK